MRKNGVLCFDDIYEVYPEAVWLLPKWLHVPTGAPGFCVMRRNGAGCELAYFTEDSKTSTQISETLYEVFELEARKKARHFPEPEERRR